MWCAKGFPISRMSLVIFTAGEFDVITLYSDACIVPLGRVIYFPSGNDRGAHRRRIRTRGPLWSGRYV